MAIKMLHDQVLIKPEEENDTSTSILLPDSAKKKPTMGRVISVGPGVVGNCSTEVIALTVKEGDLVLYRKWAGNEVKYQNEDYVVLKESEIIGMVQS